MSHGIDGLWHTFITHTPQYTHFCGEVYGDYLHHQLRSAAVPVPVEAISNLYREYPLHFGAAPAIWFEDIPSSHIAAVRRGEVPERVQRLKWSGWPGW